VPNPWDYLEINLQVAFGCRVSEVNVNQAVAVAVNQQSWASRRSCGKVAVHFSV
jgi:hypothetical protein